MFTKAKVENAIHGRLIRIMLVLVALGAILLGMASPQTAYAEPVVLYDGPFADVVQNPCISGEMVSLSGRQIMTMYARPDGSGGMHFTFRTTTKMQGTTADLLNPKKYVLNDENVTEANVPSSNTQELTQIINHGLIRQAETTGDNIFLGSGDDFMLKSTLHITFSNFVPFVTIDNGHTGCM